MAKFELVDGKLDMAGVHSSLLHNGKVLFFAAVPPDTSGPQNVHNENDVNKGLTQLWSEKDGVEASCSTSRNLFCSGHCFLPDGSLFIAAGQSNNWPGDGSPAPHVWGADHDTHTYSPLTGYGRHRDMPAARYYPTCVTLPNGDALICSGAWSRTDAVVLPSINHEAEIFHWQNYELSAPFPFNPGFIETMYPFLHVLPEEDGRGILFVFSKNKARLYSLADNQWLDEEFQAISDKSRSYHHQGSCIMLPFDVNDNKIKIMIIGGEGATHGEATKTAEIFEYRKDNPSDCAFRNPEGGRMNNKRFMGDSVHLFDGKILVVNGASEGEADESGKAVLQAEIFDPEDETWETSADLNNERMYHSTALLLPSGKVLIAGNTQNWNGDNPIEDRSMELFIPDYINATNRPFISKAPSKVFYNQKFQIEVANSSKITKVALIRCGSVTHSNNMDQRYLRVPFEKTTPTKIMVQTPDNGSMAPPGHYMVVIIDDRDIPSEAKIVKVGPEMVGFVEVFNERITVPESKSDVDTGFSLKAGDEVEMTATGEIWAGVPGTFNNGPQGWNNIDMDPKFPLRDERAGHPYCLIGKFGNNGDYFYVGESFTRQPYPFSTTKRLFLRTNDDTPHNGNGEFKCRVKVWRNMLIRSSVTIHSVESNPKPRQMDGDLTRGAGEFVTIVNTSTLNSVNIKDWLISDSATRPHIIKIESDISLAPGATLQIHTGPGPNTAGKYFAGRGSAILNNEGDTITLFDAENKMVSVFVY